MQKENVESAYQYCMNVARQHYENFPTASIFLNSAQRKATAAIYAFARHADDLADEGKNEASARLAALEQYQHQLEQTLQGQITNDPVFIALADAVSQFDMPQRALTDLLIAFRMDVTKKRYADFSELLTYCQFSANPVGELVLRLHNVCTEQNKLLSDRICTALQLINFVQDLDEDYQQRQRIYIPQDEMRKYAVSEELFDARIPDTAMEALVQQQLLRAQTMLLSGIDLVDALHGKLKLIIILTICSGLRICEKLQTRQNCFIRPTLNIFDWVKIGLQAIYFRSLKARAKLEQTSE